MGGYRKVVAIREALAAADPKNDRARGSLASADMRLGLTLSKSGDLMEALDYLCKAMGVNENMAGSKPTPNLADANYNIGSVYEQMAAD